MFKDLTRELSFQFSAVTGSETDGYDSQDVALDLIQAARNNTERQILLPCPNGSTIDLECAAALTREALRLGEIVIDIAQLADGQAAVVCGNSRFVSVRVDQHFYERIRAFHATLADTYASMCILGTVDEALRDLSKAK